MHDLVDLGLDELGNSKDHLSGAENPLAMITSIINGKEVIVSPLNSDSSDVVSGRHFQELWKVHCREEI